MTYIVSYFVDHLQMCVYVYIYYVVSIAMNWPKKKVLQ